MLKTGIRKIARNLKPILEEGFENVIYDEGSFYIEYPLHEIEPETTRDWQF